MDKKKKQLVIIAGLIIVFINSAAAAPAPAPKEAPQAPENFEGPIYRDPFKRQASIESLNSNLKKLKKISSVAGILVTGIVYDKEQPGMSYCIINGEALKLNESVDDFTVTGIKEDMVILKNNNENKEYKLKLWEDEPG